MRNCSADTFSFLNRGVCMVYQLYHVHTSVWKTSTRFMAAFALYIILQQKLLSTS